MSEQDWVRIQRKAFTRWCNSHLLDRNLVIEVLERDLSDGVILHALIEVLSGKQLPKVVKNPKSNFQKIQNLNHSLNMMTKQEQIKLVNIGAEDLLNENVKLILGLIWMLILRYQISKAEYDDDPSSGPKKALLDWCNRVLNPQGIYVKDFTSSWQDGAAFCGLVNAIEPNSIDLASLDRDNGQLDNMNRAFTDGEEKFGIVKLLDAEDVKDSPDELSVMAYVSLYRAYLSQVTPDASKCYAEGPGLTEARTKQKAPFTVFTFNDEGEKITRGGARVVANLVGPDGKETKAVVKDKLDGTYDCHYEVKTPGTYTLNVLVANNPIQGSPFSPEVKPSGPSAMHTTVSGEGKEKAVSGKEATFIIHTVDEQGTPLEEGGYKFPSTFEDPSGPIEVQVTDNQDGTYTGTYIPKKAGNTQLIVLYRSEEDGDQHVKDSPFTVAVVPGDIDFTKVEVTGNGIDKVVAGENGEIYVQAKDSHDNIVPVEPGQVTIEISGPSDIAPQSEQGDDGKVKSTFVPTVAGEYDVIVKVNDQPVREEPYKLKVTSDSTADPSNSSVEGIDNLVAGETQSPLVRINDKFGNPIVGGDENVKFSLSGPSDVEASSSNNGDGTHSGSYAPTKAGKYKVSVSVNGDDVKGTPVEIEVVPSIPDANSCVATGEGVKRAKVGKQAKFTVHLRDRFDNEIKENPGVTITSTIILVPVPPKEGKEPKQQDPPQPIEVSVTDNQDGTFSATYDVQTSGTYTLSVLVDGANIKDSEFTIRVTPGKVHIPNSKVTVKNGKAGQTGAVVRLKDANGNKRHKGGQKVTAKFTPKRIPEDPTGDNNDGTYNVVLPPNAKGDYSVEIECDGEKVPGTYDLSVEENDLKEEEKQVLSNAFPGSGEALVELLKKAPEDVREKFFNELSSLGSPQPKQSEPEVEEQQPEEVTEPEPVVEEQPEPETEQQPEVEEQQPEPEVEEQPEEEKQPEVEEQQPEEETEPEPVVEEQPEPETEQQPEVEEQQSEPEQQPEEVTEPEPVVEEQPEPETEQQPEVEEQQPEPETEQQPEVEEQQPEEETEPEPVVEEQQPEEEKQPEPEQQPEEKQPEKETKPKKKSTKKAKKSKSKSKKKK